MKLTEDRQKIEQIHWYLLYWIHCNKKIGDCENLYGVNPLYLTICKIEWHIEPHACYKCHDVLMTAYELKNIAILNVKGVDFKCILWSISRDEAVNNLNNSVLEDKGVS